MKQFVLTSVLFLMATLLMAQVPAGFSYQAVVRNSSGEIIAGKTVKFRLSILPDSPSGVPVYTETHSVATNGFGLVNLKVGMGSTLAGSFGTISWGGHSHYLKVEMDPNNGNTFTHLGTSQLLAVPYALHSQSAESLSGTLTETDPKGVSSASVAGTNTKILTIILNDASIVTAQFTDLVGEAGSGDNWGADVVHTDPTLTGQGTTALPLKVAQQSATTGQVLKWSGTTWTPATDENEDNDSNAANELQNLSVEGNTLKLSKSTATLDLSSYMDNTDSQTLSITDNNLSISGGNTVTLPSSGSGGDDWGNEYVHTDVTLAGQGTTAAPLKMAQQSATTGQVLKWSGTTWAPAADEMGDGGSNPTGSAGGDLTGTYPNPLIGDEKVTSGKILDGTIGSADLADQAVTSQKIADGAIAEADLANSAVTNDKLANLSVSTVKIQNSAVSTDKLADNAVTVAKLPGGATASTFLRGDGTWAVPSGSGSGLWTESTGNIYFNGGNVGIGLDKPIYMLHVEAPIAGGTAIWGRSNSDTPGTRGVFGGEYGTVNGTANTLSGAFAGVMGYTNWARSYHYGVMGVRADRDYGNSAGVIGMVDGTKGDKPWGALGYQDAALQEWAGYFKGIVKADQLHVSGNTWTAGIITGPSNLTQDADLDVTGTVKLGSSGIVFKEIKELTGTTDATKNYVSIYFNTGITAKMRILSAEINASGTNWNTLGMTDSRDPGRSVGCSVTNNYIHLHYPGTDAYFNRNYRILVMILP